MPLVTSQGYNLVPDSAGAVNRGLEMVDQAKMRGLAIQGQEQQQQMQGLAMQRQQAQNVSQQDVEAAKAMISGAYQLKGITDPAQKLQFLAERQRQFKEAGFNTAGIDDALNYARVGDWDTLSAKTDELISLGDQMKFGPQKTETSSDTDSLVLPSSVTDGLSDSEKLAAQGAFEAAGGGKDGLKAARIAASDVGERSQKANAPELVQSLFPKATGDQKEQLSKVIQSAKSLESGIKAAKEMRAGQRQESKALQFKDKAISLLKRIKSSDQIGDVVGSLEGAYDWRLSDSESELIADITEASNILTAENLDLMSGVLSESDLALLKNISGGSLNRKRSEESFRRDLDSLINTLSKASGADLPEEVQNIGAGQFTTKSGLTFTVK
jgi:hypothetical protein